MQVTKFSAKFLRKTWFLWHKRKFQKFEKSFLRISTSDDEADPYADYDVKLNWSGHCRTIDIDDVTIQGLGLCWPVWCHTSHTVWRARTRARNSSDMSSQKPLSLSQNVTSIERCMKSQIRLRLTITLITLPLMCIVQSLGATKQILLTNKCLPLRQTKYDCPNTLIKNSQI